MQLKYFIDEFASQLIAIAARRVGVDAISSHETGRDGLNDDEQLLWAGINGLCVVTQNYSDFRPLSDAFREKELPHAGVLFLRSGRITRNHTGAIVAALAAHAAHNPDGMPPYMIDFLRF